MKKKTGLIIAGIVAVVLVAPNLNKGSDAPSSSGTTCPTAVPADAKKMGSISFQSGATSVTGHEGITVTGGGSSWQAKDGKEVDLSIERKEVEPPQDPKSQDKKPSAQTNIFNNNFGWVTLVDSAQKCALSLGPVSNQVYAGSVTVTVYAKP